MTTQTDTTTGPPDSTQPPQVRDHHLNVPQSALDDLRQRLEMTRWPDRETVTDTTQGPQLDKLQALVSHWRNGYDWRRCEALLNGLGQSVTEIDGLDIHFLHVRSPEPNALPLVLTHGWPGSVLEFRHVIGPLTDPLAHGGEAGDAFHVVVPSLPGFGFSGKPTGTGWGLPRTAAAWSTLMQRLGYDDHWVAQGGDWGSAVTTVLGHMQPAGLAGIHLNLVAFQPTPEEVADATPHEQTMLADAGNYYQNLAAYMSLQATRPQTIGYSLADSPAGLAAWIYAMFQDVSDSRGDAESVFTMDEMLDDITLYWLTNTGASSARLYWEAMSSGAGGAPSGPLALPTGISMFPREQIRLSRRWAQSRFSNLIHFDEPAAGGHFAALEQPAVFVDQLRACFAGLRR